MKVKLFSHNDLDGYGCVIVANRVFGEKNVDYQCLNYDKIDQEVDKFLTEKEHGKYDLVFITDISVSNEIAEKLDKDLGNKVILLDHHDTALRLNKYNWATVSSTRIDGTKTSGTSMLYDYLVEKGQLTSYGRYKLRDFVEAVRRYDSWEWFNIYKDDHPKRLNNLFQLIGKDKFVKRFTNSPFIAVFTEGEELLLEVEEERIKNYIKMTSKDIYRKEIDGYNVGVVFADRYLSELGSDIVTNNPDLDFVAMVNIGGRSVSLRGNKEHIHLGEYSENHGGGGHRFASGFGFKEELDVREIIVRLVFQDFN